MTFIFKKHIFQRTNKMFRSSIIKSSSDKLIPVARILKNSKSSELEFKSMMFYHKLSLYKDLYQSIKTLLKNYSFSFVKECYVEQAFNVKRLRKHGRGRAYTGRKRYSRIVFILE